MPCQILTDHFKSCKCPVRFSQTISSPANALSGSHRPFRVLQMPCQILTDHFESCKCAVRFSQTVSSPANALSGSHGPFRVLQMRCQILTDHFESCKCAVRFSRTVSSPANALSDSHRPFRVLQMPCQIRTGHFDSFISPDDFCSGICSHSRARPKHMRQAGLNRAGCRDAAACSICSSRGLHSASPGDQRTISVCAAPRKIAPAGAPITICSRR
jgi:hypothetical protein